MGNRTPLYQAHQAMGAKLVDFAGWDMPIHYGSQIEEHHAVRRAAGMFDVSHMTVVDLHGENTRPLLRFLLANDVDKLKKTGKALYSCMLNDSGKVLDDLIVYYLSDTQFRLVVNSATRAKDLDWIVRQAGPFEVQVSERPELAMIAVQGPQARDKVLGLLDDARRTVAAGLGLFYGAALGDWFIARTGYTGEDGWEIVMPAADAPATWDRLVASGIVPCGIADRPVGRIADHRPGVAAAANRMNLDKFQFAGRRRPWFQACFAAA